MKYQPAEQKEYHHSTPKNPFILSSSSFYHSDSITTDAQRVSDTV